ncbi:TetR/AcrR family transcriptional regulator [uncultured Senegalimassilia sp.]|uniref:TetR/AcrR family transcriptional regulator n=1 Tax=uncultured Senegalimassilia sp. TaxID=1714350 RepID=UPI002672F221|nr:TetR family transcriptional regulator [uncultured Senegalimassilia sp.]
MGEANQTPKSLKAQITRTSLVLAAAALLREQGPKAVTYRKVAQWAGAASSSVGYYFESTNQLLYEAGRYNIQLWAERAENSATTAESMDQADCRKHLVNLLISASLPDDSVNPAAHYMQLLAASESEDVTEAYRNGRVQLDQAVGRILKHAGVGMPSHIVGAVVDGAAVTAVSEGRDVRELAAGLLKDVLAAFDRDE